MAKKQGPLELTPEAAWEAYWVEGKTFPECAELFGKSVGTLHRRFAEWQFPTRGRGPRIGTAGPNVRITDDQIRYILETVGEKSVRTLESELGVTFQRIQQIRAGKHRPLSEE